MKKKQRLTSQEKAQCEALIQACHQVDGTFHQTYLDNLYNVNPDMPAFLLVENEGQLQGFLAIYADEPGYAQVDLFVHPEQRRKGIAKQLLTAFDQIATDYQLTEIEYVTEADFLASHPDLFENWQLQEIGDREMWLVMDNQTLDCPIRKDLLVKLASLSDVEAIAQFQSSAFEQDLEMSRHYAKEGIENEDTDLFLLETNGEVVGSVTVDKSQGSNHFFGLAIAPDHQGKGYGTYLMKTVINHLANETEEPFQIVVESDNTPAKDLYLKLGFEAKTEVVYLQKD